MKREAAESGGTLYWRAGGWDERKGPNNMEVDYGNNN